MLREHWPDEIEGSLEEASHDLQSDQGWVPMPGEVLEECMTFKCENS